MLEILQRTHGAAPALRRLSDTQRHELLLYLADHLDRHHAPVLAANTLDLAKMPDADPKKDRLMLNPQRLEAIAQSIRDVANLPVPDGETLVNRTLPNGIQLRKISVPLGVVGVIYESRPNVTLDVSALCLRSGNAVALRGGSDAIESNKAIVALIHDSLRAFGIPTDIVQLLPTDRELLHELFNATRYVDVIIPRGSDALIQFVRQHSRVPTIETGAGVCHTYVHASADLQKAQRIVVNAKLTRPSVCNALDTVLVDTAIAASFLPLLCPDFEQHNVEVFADEASFEILKNAGYLYLQHATPDHFGREFLDFKCSIKIVNGLDEALTHIDQYSSRHSEAIVAEDAAAWEQFIHQVDAAAVYANASTRFTDGGEFGLGAEIGISTQKLHARGPFALEKLVTEKWVAVGDGQVR